MHAHHYASAAFALATQWAVGIAATAAIADTEQGLIRDHPTYGRRLCTSIVPPFITAGLMLPFLINGHLVSVPPRWMIYSFLALLPFAGLSYVWSRTWLQRTPAQHRRRLGRLTLVSGVAGLLVSGQLAVAFLQPAWRPTFPTFLFLGTAGLLGALTHFSLVALTQGLPQEVPGGPARHVAEMAGFGLLATALPALELGGALLTGARGWPSGALRLGWVWAACALVIPGLLLLSRLLRRHLPDTALMPIALLFAVAGQFAGLLLIFLFPGLLPPLPDI